MRMSEFPVLLEIKDEYIRHRQEGCDRATATQKVMDSYKQEIHHYADDDGLFVWIGLADAQFYRKELTVEIAAKATEAIDILSTYDWDICPGDLKRKKDNYARAPMPERKVGKPRPPFQCPWEIGDTFAYRLSGPDAESCGIAGQYALLRKVGDLDCGHGAIHPVVTVTIWKKEPFPTSSSEFASVPILKLQAGGRQFSPRDKFEYRTELVIKTKKQLAGLSLTYLGNFPDVPMPEDEIIFTEAGVMLMILPEKIDYKLAIYYRNNQKFTSGTFVNPEPPWVGFFKYLSAISENPDIYNVDN